LRGVALALWIVFTPPRVPDLPVLERQGKRKMVQVPLTLEHCHGAWAPPRTLRDAERSATPPASVRRR
jgi:hypothetical protein